MKSVIKVLLAVLTCVFAAPHLSHAPESIERCTRPKCPKVSPFCEFDDAGTTYYYFYKDKVAEIWSIYEEIGYNPRAMIRYVKKAKKCYSSFYKKHMGKLPVITDDKGPIFVMVVSYDHLNRGSVIKEKYKGYGRIAAVSRCSYHNDVWPEVDERSIIFIAAKAINLKNVSHETFHQMVCRTKNWTKMLTEKGIVSVRDIGNYEEDLAEKFEDYECLYK